MLNLNLLNSCLVLSASEDVICFQSTNNCKDCGISSQKTQVFQQDSLDLKTVQSERNMNLEGFFNDVIA